MGQPVFDELQRNFSEVVLLIMHNEQASGLDEKCGVRLCIVTGSTHDTFSALKYVATECL